jgi:formylglycine-generating enzyme required for sulfatase activity
MWAFVIMLVKALGSAATALAGAVGETVATLAHHALAERALRHIEKGMEAFKPITDHLLRFQKPYKEAMAERHQRFWSIRTKDLVLAHEPRLQDFFLPLYFRQRGSGARVRWQEVFANNAATNQRVVIVGRPGAGKSTLLSYLVLQALGRVKEPPLPELYGRLPIHVELRETRRGSQVHPVRQLLESSSLGVKPPRDFPDALLGKGRCLVLLDGLDEVPNEELGRVSEEIQALVSAYRNNEYVVSCRAEAWRDDLLPGFVSFEIQPLEATEIRRFIEICHRKLAAAEPPTAGGGPVAAGSDRRSTLFHVLDDNSDLFQLATNPLLLSIMAVLYFADEQPLPQHRAGLYARCTDLLLQHCAPASPAARARQRAVLQAAAYLFLHNGNRAVAELPRHVVNLLQGQLTEQAVASELQLILDKSDLLVWSADHETCDFVHRSIRDCLAAQHILELGLDERVRSRAHLGEWREVVLNTVGLTSDHELVKALLENLLAKGQEPGYQDAAAAFEVAASALAERERGTVDADLCREIIGGVRRHLEVVDAAVVFNSLAKAWIRADVDNACAWFDGELQRRSSAFRRWIVRLLPCLGYEHRDRFLSILITLVRNDDEDPHLRTLAVETLAKIGAVQGERKPEMVDALRVARSLPSPPGLLAAVSWAQCELGDYEQLGLVKIMEGDFRTGVAADRVQYLPTYYISRHPVTVGEFREFVEQTDRVPHYDASLLGHANHPVRWVTWGEARAYAGWCGLGLPSSEEWEKAARGEDGRRFPWGAWRPGRANTHEYLLFRTRREVPFGELKDEDRTTPIGHFPDGQSPYGCQDMAGNVWEWTHTEADAPPAKAASEIVRQPDGAPLEVTFRVVRGGSFVEGRRDCQCDKTLARRQDYGRPDIGFRLVSSPQVLRQVARWESLLG